MSTRMLIGLMSWLTTKHSVAAGCTISAADGRLSGRVDEDGVQLRIVAAALGLPIAAK